MSWLLAALALICSLALLWVGFCFALRAFDRGEVVRLSVTGLSTFAREWAAHVYQSLLFPLGLIELGPRPFGDALDPAEPGPVPVLLLPGYGANRACMSFMAAYLRRRGWRWVWGVNHGRHSGGVHGLAQRLSAQVDQLRTVSGAEQIDIVAHSLGGVIAAHYLLHLGGGPKVRRLITLGSPFLGTRMGGFARSQAARELLPTSPIIRGLGPLPTPTFAVVADRDQMLIPPHIGRPSWLPVVDLEGVAHSEMLTNGRCLRLVRDLLLGPAPRQLEEARA
ncbi:MAG: alpha/beta fold hydrolase [Alphaproteobacteria bacterium]|nr:alpha/beta fold hydrolase [Alphaproteobacteria bacterium]